MSQPNQYAQPQPPPPPTVPVQGPVTISPVIVVGQHVHYSHVNHAPLPNAAAPPLAVSNAAMTGVPAATGSYQYTAPAPVYQIPAVRCLPAPCPYPRTPC